MTKIGYKFINWALLFFVGVILCDVTRDVNGMEGVIIDEHYKGDTWTKDLQTIDLDDSFVYIQIEKNDKFKIGDRVKVISNKSILNLAHPFSGLLTVILIVTCVMVALFRITLILQDDSNYKYLKD